MEGYSVDETAAILDCAPGTVKSRCSRGRARLLPLLVEHRTRPPAEDTVAGPGVGRGNPPTGPRVPPLGEPDEEVSSSDA
jgi:RNA polymerase sigma-70 factor (ECF subfamily)